MRSHISIPIADPSSIGEARRAALRLAEQANLNDADAGRVSIVVTELATNLTRHVGSNGGEILLGENSLSGSGEIEIASIDTGPGMNDIGRCFEDGFSTAGTPGTGLGAVRRLSDELDVFSSASGTVLWTRITSRNIGAAPINAMQPSSIRIGGVSVPAPGEEMCGDAWRMQRAGNHRISLMIADGLGHGPLAAEASNAACQSFDQDPFSDPGKLIELMHTSISTTRGAAVAIARIEPESQKLFYSGVGNIAGTLLAPDGSSRGLFSHNGTVGHQMRKAQVFDYPWLANSVLVVHSDGLQSRWSLDNYPGLVRRHPAVIARVLYRDSRRGRDDISVVVVGSSEFAH